MQPIRLLIADDEELIRLGLIRLFERQSDFELLATAVDGIDTLRAYQEHKPDLILLDIQMPQMNGIEVIRHLRQFDQQVKILILTTFSELDYITDGLQCGANGYLLKRMKPERILRSLRDVMDDELILPAEIATKLAFSATHREPVHTRPDWIIQRFEQLTTKTEALIMYHLYLRQSNDEICEQLGITNGTLRNHLSKIYSKLSINSRNEALAKINQLLFLPEQHDLIRR